MWEEHHIRQFLTKMDIIVRVLDEIREEISETKHEVDKGEQSESPNNRDDEDGTP